MDHTPIALYDCFYTPPSQTELENEVDECHKQLIERLEKPERKLVLRIINAQDAMKGRLSQDSFSYGFKLGLALSEELQYFRQIHSIYCRDSREKV